MYVFTFLVHHDRDVDLIIKICENNGFKDKGYSLVHLSPTRNIDQLATYTKSTKCLYNTFHINHVFALKRKFEVNTQAILGDYFPGLFNTNYLKEENIKSLINQIGRE